MTPSPRLPAGNEDGFTLLEILVSLAILSVSLATLLGIFSMSIARSRQSEDEMTARVLAQSLLEQAGAVTDPRLGTTSGQAGQRFTWHLALAPYDTTRNAQSAATPLAAMQASVIWQGTGGTRSLTLTSLRTLPKTLTP